ncbi:MAG: MinD/ParA family ATP-binding protein [Thermogutta sp.]
MNRTGVMYDQAYQLRQLVSRVRPATGEEPGPTIQVRIWGVRHGVGASTIVNALAQHWQRSGWNVFLSNGNPSTKTTESEDRSLRVDFCGNGEQATLRPPQLDREVTRLTTPSPVANPINGAPLQKTLFLKDGGVVDDQNWLICEKNERLVLVTTPAPADIMKAYVVAKRILRKVSSAHLVVVVNKSPHLSIGEEMARRLENACQRFLGANRVTQFVLPIFPQIKRPSPNRCPAGEAESAGQIWEHVTAHSFPREDEANDALRRTIPLIARTIIENPTYSSRT